MDRRLRISGVAVLLALSMLSAGACSPSEDSSTGGTAATASQSGELGPGASAGPQYLERPEQVPELLREKFGEVPRMRRLNLTDDGITLELRDPAKPENLDTWRYSDGEWTSTPVSVSLSEIEQFDETTFGPESIAWDSIPELIQHAYDGVELEDEEITTVSYDKLAGAPPRVYIGISGLRGNGRLLGSADGTQYEVTRN